MNKEWLRLSIFFICTKTEDKNTAKQWWHETQNRNQDKTRNLEDVACIQLGSVGERSSIVSQIKLGSPPRKMTTDSCERNFYVRLCTPLQLIFSTSRSGEPTVSNWAHSIMVDKKCTGCPEKEGREALWLPSSDRIHSVLLSD